MKPDWHTVGLRINAGGCEYKRLTDDSEWQTVVNSCVHCHWLHNCDIRDSAIIKMHGDMSAISDAVSQLAHKARGKV